MKTTTNYGELEIQYIECTTVKEFFDEFEWDLLSDDDHLYIVYKDGSIFDSYDYGLKTLLYGQKVVDCKKPKKTGIFSAVFSSSCGYSYYNATPIVEEEEEGETYYYCETKDCEMVA